MPSIANAIAGSRASLAPYRAEKKREFNGITRLRTGRTAVGRTHANEIAAHLKAARAAIGRVLASEEVVRRVAAHHPDALWSFYRNGRPVGCLAMLMLNDAGLEALLSDAIDLRDPPQDCLSDPTLPPRAIYVWGLIALPLAIDGVSEVILRLNAAGYRMADVYATQATDEGARLMRRLGFEPVPNVPRKLFRYVRLGNRVH
jgi:hypothetical protein